MNNGFNEVWRLMGWECNDTMGAGIDKLASGVSKMLKSLWCFWKRGRSGWCWRGDTWTRIIQSMGTNNLCCIVFAHKPTLVTMSSPRWENGGMRQNLRDEWIPSKHSLLLCSILVFALARAYTFLSRAATLWRYSSHRDSVSASLDFLF